MKFSNILQFHKNCVAIIQQFLAKVKINIYGENRTDDVDAAFDYFDRIVPYFK